MAPALHPILVNTTRSVAGAAPTPVLTGVRVAKKRDQIQYRPEGTVIVTEFQFPPGSVAGPTDLRPGDFITVQREASAPAYRPLRAYQINHVEHVASSFGLGKLRAICIGGVDV